MRLNCCALSLTSNFQLQVMHTRWPPNIHWTNHLLHFTIPQGLCSVKFLGCVLRFCLTFQSEINFNCSSIMAKDEHGLCFVDYDCIALCSGALCNYIQIWKRTFGSLMSRTVLFAFAQQSHLCYRSNKIERILLDCGSIISQCRKIEEFTCKPSYFS